MKEKENLSDLSIDKLYKKEKDLKTSSGMIVAASGVLIGLIIVMIFKGITTVAIPLAVIPIAMIPILVNAKKTITQIRTEIASREATSK